jgi:DNA-binding NarL/FixJ family response regulator
MVKLDLDRIRRDYRQAVLTRRECEVLNLIRVGLTNRQIAAQLSVSTNTINKHVQQVLSKLNVSNRVQAAMYPRELAG